MKKLFILGAAAAVVLGLAGCSTLGISASTLTGALAKNVETAVADFKSDEVLCSVGDDTMIRSGYDLAKIMTPASDKTKQQSEVLFVKDGSKAWVKWVIPSRKAEKADFVVGAVLLYPHGWAGYDKISPEEYRTTRWYLGRVTSVDDMFKNMIEIAGESYAISLIRVPTVKVEE